MENGTETYIKGHSIHINVCNLKLKICAHCANYKPLSNFYTRGNNILRPECKNCTKLDQKFRNKKGNDRRYRIKKRIEILSHYSHKSFPLCKGCNLAELAVLTIDHINDNGSEERRMGLSPGVQGYLQLRKSGYPKGYQVLCWNCQWRKRLGVPFPKGDKNL